MAGSAAPRLPHEGKAPRDLTHARRLYAPEYWAGRITVGCATYQELGEHVRLSANTVADRVRRLRRDGVLTGFAAVIDEKALGMELGVLSDLKLKEGVSRVAFAESLTHVPQVIGALRLTGEYDYHCTSCAAAPPSWSRSSSGSRASLTWRP